jgi:hypothetical protein
MNVSVARTRVGALYLRAVYFSEADPAPVTAARFPKDVPLPIGLRPRDPRARTLTSLTEVFEQLDLFIAYAPLVAHTQSAGRPVARAKRGELTFNYGQIDVVTVCMASPLEIVLDIPTAAWVGGLFGLLALAERIATAPVRISRKRKEELYEIAVLDRATAALSQPRDLVAEAPADALSELILQARLGAGPDEITFFDPEDPDEELEPITVAPS